MVVPGYRTSAELAEMYGVHQSSVSRQCKQGKVAGAVATPRGEWLIPVEVSEKLVFGHYQKGPAARQDEK